MKLRNLITIFITALLVSAVFAQEQSGNSSEKLTLDEIVKKANIASYYQGDDGKARVNMVITDKQDRKREREFVILRRDVKDGGDQKYYVYFHRPADVRRMVFMVHKHAGLDKDDDRWLYLPNLDLVKRIAASDKRTSFVGSDYLYEDVSGRGVELDSHELKEETDSQYVLKHTPKNPELVEFKYYLTYIDKETFLPMKIEYFDDKDRSYRLIEAMKVEKIGDKEYPTVTKSKVTDKKRESTTEMEFSDIQYNIGIEDDIFTERYLRRPPREARR